MINELFPNMSPGMLPSLGEFREVILKLVIQCTLTPSTDRLHFIPIKYLITFVFLTTIIEGGVVQSIPTSFSVGQGWPLHTLRWYAVVHAWQLHKISIMCLFLVCHGQTQKTSLFIIIKKFNKKNKKTCEKCPLLCEFSTSQYYSLWYSQLKQGTVAYTLLSDVSSLSAQIRQGQVKWQNVSVTAGSRGGGVPPAFSSSVMWAGSVCNGLLLH